VNVGEIAERFHHLRPLKSFVLDLVDSVEVDRFIRLRRRGGRRHGDDQDGGETLQRSCSHRCLLENAAPSKNAIEV
jgi:hypothetical protein